MRKKVGTIRKYLAVFLIVAMSINSFGAIVSDNDGSAFITKAEFDALKSSFQAQIDSYNQSIDSKIDGAIASYLAGIQLAQSEDVIWNTNFNNTIRFYGQMPHDGIDDASFKQENKTSFAAKYGDGVEIVYYMVDYFAGSYRQAGSVVLSFTNGAKSSADWEGNCNRISVNNYSWGLEPTLDFNNGYLQQLYNYSYYYWTVSGNGYIVSGTACGPPSSVTNASPSILWNWDDMAKPYIEWQQQYSRGTKTTSKTKLYPQPKISHSASNRTSSAKYIMFGKANSESEMVGPTNFTENDTSHFTKWLMADTATLIKTSDGINYLADRTVTHYKHNTTGPVVQFINPNGKATMKVIRLKGTRALKDVYCGYIKELGLPDTKLYEGLPIGGQVGKDGKMKIDVTVQCYTGLNTLSSSTAEAYISFNEGPFGNTTGNNNTLKKLNAAGVEDGYASNLITSSRKLTVTIPVKKGKTYYIKMYPNLSSREACVRISNLQATVTYD